MTVRPTRPTPRRPAVVAAFAGAAVLVASCSGTRYEPPPEPDRLPELGLGPQGG